MFEILKTENFEFIEDKLIQTAQTSTCILKILEKQVAVPKYGKVIDIVKLGYAPVEKNPNFPICKKKIAIMKDNKPEVREISVSSTSDYIRLIDTSDAGREFVLNIDEIVSLADKHGLFR